MQIVTPRHEDSQQLVSGYIPSLDGWRTIAVSIVLLDHGPTFHFSHHDTSRFHNLGNFGVQIFFALSGFLITNRLLDEERLTRCLNLRSFYVRRVTRIQPAALTYLLFVFLLTCLHRLPRDTKALLAAVFLVRNYVQITTSEPAWPTAHFWSLSVEEHFYLLLPAFLLLVKRWRLKVLLLASVADLAWYAYYLSQHHWFNDGRYFHTDLSIHTLLLGATLAVALRNQTIALTLKYAVRWWWAVPLTLYLAKVSLQPRAVLLIFMPFFLILGTVLNPQSLLGRLLELAPFRFIGKISYSIYLWQMVFLTHFWVPRLKPFGNWQSSPLALVALAGCVLLSYYAIERPFIRLGHRWAKPATQGRNV